MREQRVTLERLDHADDAVVATDAQVVALRDVVGEHHSAAATHPAQRGEEHRALAVFLASEDAGYITGQIIAVDGGIG